MTGKRTQLEFRTGEIKTPPRKRHRCLRVIRDGNLGYVEKMDTAEIKSLILRNNKPKLRLLGEEVSDIESPKSYVAEVEDGENIMNSIQRLHDKIEKMMENAIKTNKEMTKIKSENVAMKKSLSLLDEFILDEGCSLCVRAFADFIVNGFYRAGGKALVVPANQRRWLEGTDALEFAKMRNSVKFFGKTFKIDVHFLSLVRKLRSMSAQISRTKCHRFRPAQVAYSFDKLKTNADVVQFFETCFSISLEEILNLQIEGNLPPQFNIEYS